MVDTPSPAATRRIETVASPSTSATAMAGAVGAYRPPLGDDRPDARDRADQPFTAEFGERLRRGGHRDVPLPGDLAGGRHTIARRQLARLDPLPQFGDDPRAPGRWGQTVDLCGAGRTVVARMGLPDRARELSVDQRGLAFVDASGRVTARMPADSFRSGPLHHDRRDPAAQQQLIARRFAGAGWEVPRLLRAMRTAPDFFFDSMGQVRLDRWSEGRIVLLGDAGYCPTPLTGLGTSLALVGAYVLAGELATADGDHRVAFPNYDLMAAQFAKADEIALPDYDRAAVRQLGDGGR